jgi:glucose/arabinose dehydrogenase
MLNARLTLLATTLAFFMLLAAPSWAQIPGDVTLDSAFGGASFSTPVALRHAGDGSNRKFVVERNGQIRIVDAGGNVLANPFLDSFADPVSTTGEGGLLGLAFHPDYASNGRFFVYYTWDNGTGLISRISEFTVGANPDVANPASEQVILEVPQDFTNHNGGDLHFGPEGYLWIGLGDGGSGNDPCNRSQTLDPADLLDCGSHPTTDAKALLGKMLRIDIDNTTPAGSNDLCAAAGDGSAPYAVPTGSGPSGLVFRDRFELDTPALPAGTCAETWAYGLRNPYRFSFDRDTGDLWIGDVGQNTWEEVDFELASNSGGDNYGWKICEGDFQRGSTTTACSLNDHHAPVATYRTGLNGNCSVTGGFRYRGPVTSLQGRYVYGDFCSGRIWFAQDAGGGAFSVDEFGLAGGNVFGFGEDEAGELYVMLGGEIRIFNGNR